LLYVPLVFAAVIYRRYSRKMIIRARVVVTMDGPPVENGAVAISQNRIVDVGTFADVEKRNRGEILDLGEHAILPGLINAHCHLDYTCLRGKIPPQNTFVDWIRAINAAKAKLSKADYVASVNEGVAEAKRFGTTAIANFEAFPELITQVEASIRTWWFAELMDVREPERTKEIVDRAVLSLKAAENWGLAPHAPFTASGKLYRYTVEVAQGEDVLLSTHLAESQEEMSMFHDGAGPLREFVKEVGRDVSDCGGTTPLARFLEIVKDPSVSLHSTRADNQWIAVHLNELSARDFDLLERSKNRFHLVHCPRSHAFFGHSPFKFEELHQLGLNICLGTDSLASNRDLSLFAEMRTFQRHWPGVSPENILSMVTVNPAAALGKPDVLGRIRQDFFADLVAIPFRGSFEHLFNEIIAHEGEVALMIIAGRAAKL
jgi:cytosine/adenosine deaminase-related metal-dependent hydrolase